MITYLDTYGDGGYSYKDFEEYCKEQNWDTQEELEIPAEDSASYCEWVRSNIDDDIECFFENIKYAKDVNGPCVVSGSLGLWNGRHEIEPKRFDSLVDAVKACWGGADAVRVTGDGGAVYIEAIHHDGTNSFEIRKEAGEYPEYLY